MWAPARVGIAGNEKADLRRDRLLWAIWCTKFTSNCETDCWTNGRKVGKSLKQECFRTPSFPRSFLDHCGMEDGEKTYNDCLEDYLGALQS
jgi:hypothetical protein